MKIQRENAGRFLLQVLYDNYGKGKHYSSETLAHALEMEETLVQETLDRLVDTGLITEEETGYRLSEKGYSVAYQRATSFCPHL